MFTNKVIASTIACLTNSNINATCDSNDDNPSMAVRSSYHPFIEPKLKSNNKSHYNFIQDSIDYRTNNKQQLKLYDNYMNDVLSFANINKWQRITQCLNNDKNNPSKQLMCKSLVTDYHIANEDMLSAQSTIKSAYDIIPNKYNDLSLHHREELYVRAFYEWIINFDQKEAQKIFRHISNKYPYDLYAAKRAQEMSFDLSDWDSMLEIFTNIKDYHLSNGKHNKTGSIPSSYFNGLLSFAYEQKGYLEKAEETALNGLEYFIDDNWLQHSLIHSRYFQENTEKDLLNLIKYIVENGSKYWDIQEKHAFITTHNWWHIALLYLELDDLENAEKIFTENIWRKNLDRRADQIGALSMFWILTMIIDSKKLNDQIDKDLDKMLERICNLWENVMDFVIETNKNIDVGYKLYDLLFIRGVIEMKQRYFGKNKIKYNIYKDIYDKRYKDMVKFCDDNKELKKKYIGLVDSMNLMYGENSDWINKMWCYEEIMSLIINDLNIIGGSREQRFVFDQMYIDLLLMLDERQELRKFLKDFLDKYPLKSLELIATNIPKGDQHF